MMSRRFLLIVLLVGGFWYLAAGHSFVPGFSPSSLLGSHGELPLSRSTGPLVLEEVKAAPEYDAEELTNIAVYKRLLPSVVNVTSTSLQMDFFYGPVPSQGQGSGFVLDRQGHIATNYHVIADAQNIEVQTADKHRYKAQIIGKDAHRDIALLQIQAPNLQPVNAGDLAQPGAGAEGVRDRQPLRAERHHDDRHYLCHPLDSRPGGRQDRERDPDRCRDQPRQFGRPAAQLARRGHRHQHADCDESQSIDRPERGHRLCHPDRYGQGGAERL